jgi:hypothetical protein
MVTTTDAVTSTRSKPWSYISTILPPNRNHLKQTTAAVGVMINLRIVTTRVTSTALSICAGPVRP